MAETPESLLGKIVADRYELLTLLGKGKSGMVFKALHRQVDRFVAVKIVSTREMEQEAYLRFQREARAIGRLNHPNIVSVLDIGVMNDSIPFLVLDYIEGRDLHDLISTDGRVNIARALKIISQACSALSHAHRRGVIHRDLKPSNIMLMDAEDTVDFVKVVDFGIAKPSDQKEIDEGLTLEGHVVGTPLYMSPEQCKGQALDARTDIYALGCVLFKMITGQTPISGTALLEIMNNQVNSQPYTFEEAAPSLKVPAEIQKVIYKALSKAPDNRQQSMAVMRDELNAAYASLANARGHKAEHNPGEDTIQHGMAVIGRLRDKAVAGDPISMYELVLRLEYGQGCERNLEEAAQWLKLAAQNGLKEAQWRLGDHFLRKESGYPFDPHQAFLWLGKSAEQGYDAAQFELGWCYEHGLGTAVDPATAVKWYQVSSKQGNAQATEQLRKCFEKISQSSEGNSAAESFLELQIKNNDPDAMYSMALRLKESGKRANDHADAAGLFQKAAVLGHDAAQVAYATVCLLGDGLPVDNTTAVYWLEEASEKGSVDASLLLAACLKTGTGTKCNLERAAALLTKLAETDTRAKVLLAASSLTGDGVPRNIPRGIATLKQASDENNGYAMWKMALCYRNGIGVTKDPRQAETLLAKSAEQSFPQGLDRFWKPTSLAFTEVIQYFTAASTQGNRNAAYWLGLIYEYGQGTTRDLNKALEFYQQASSRGVEAGRKAIERLQSR